MAARRIAVAEFVGTFVLVFGGVGSAVIAGEVIGALGVAFAFGLSLLAMAYAIGPISGCHINPAVTVGLVFSRRLTWPESVQYFAARSSARSWPRSCCSSSSSRPRAPSISPRTASAPTASATTRPAATR